MRFSHSAGKFTSDVKKVMCFVCVMQEKARAHQRKIEIVERSRQHTRHMYQQARANEMAMRMLGFI
jgi:hypothetical protein